MLKTDSHLVLITNNYPFSHDGGEVMFVDPEVDFLISEFDVVTIAPCHPNGTLVANCEGIDLDVSLGLSLSPSVLRRLLYLVQALAFGGFLNVSGEFLKAFRRHGWKGFRKAALWTASAAATCIWLKKKIPDGKKAIIYTYWNADATVGALFFAAERKEQVRVVSRCHGYDLYEERNSPPYLPYRSYVYRNMDALAPISEAGAKHARECGMDSRRISVNRLGVDLQSNLCQPSLDNVIRICSCSSMVPVKRVPFIAKVLNAFAKKNSSLIIEWTHFGAGVDWFLVAEQVQAAPENLRAVLKGAVGNLDVLHHYKNKPVDLFINLSESEGIPVSMMEVCSFGIPIVATKVGGVPEIVGDENGALLPSNPTVDNVVFAIEIVLRNSTNKFALRNNAKDVWAKKFDSKVVHREFARYLKGLLV